MDYDLELPLFDLRFDLLDFGLSESFICSSKCSVSGISTLLSTLANNGFDGGDDKSILTGFSRPNIISISRSMISLNTLFVKRVCMFV